MLKAWYEKKKKENISTFKNNCCMLAILWTCWITLCILKINFTCFYRNVGFIGVD